MSAAKGIHRRILGLLEENQQRSSIAAARQMLQLKGPEQQQILKTCEAFHVSIGRFLTALDRGIYQNEERFGINGGGRGASRHAKRAR
jgi:hypothetical protein